VATSTSKSLRFHEIIEMLIASGELKPDTAFLAATQEDTI
jgi:hypothetical protein